MADNGEPGEANFMKGTSAEHLVVQVVRSEEVLAARHAFLQVPVGTIVKKLTGKLVCELKRDEQKFIAARGGLGEMTTVRSLFCSSPSMPLV